MTSSKSIHEFPGVQEKFGFNVKKLGCVMLPVSGYDALEDREWVLSEDDLYYSPDPDKFWVKGNVGKAGGHVTLLYGLLQPAYELEDVINEVMTGWESPAYLAVSEIELFESPYPDEPYACIVARVEITHEIADAHSRLSYLPHVDTFPGYKPHVTLAYVKREEGEKWVDILNLGHIVFDVEDRLDLGKRHG